MGGLMILIFLQTLKAPEPDPKQKDTSCIQGVCPFDPPRFLPPSLSTARPSYPKHSAVHDSAQNDTSRTS